MATLVKELRRTNSERGATTSVNFVTASPPQIGRAIREKLMLDGIEIDEIRFKNQIQHLVRGQFDALREHVGFKLSELLQSARAGRRDGCELLFGDDWESDPLIYSMYADIIEKRLPWSRLEGLLARVGVQEGRYLQSIRASIDAQGPQRSVPAIFILRARPRPRGELDPFGPRLVWFDSYLECALILHALGDLDARGVMEVVAASGAAPATVEAAFEATATRWPQLRREHLTLARAALVEAQLMPPVQPGSLLRRAWTRWRVARSLSPAPPHQKPPPMPDYEQLVQMWTYRSRKEREGAAVHEQEE